jgi:hypothetical protein
MVNQHLEPQLLAVSTGRHQIKLAMLPALRKRLGRVLLQRPHQEQRLQLEHRSLPHLQPPLNLWTL